jgi:hypothetical protein
MTCDSSPARCRASVSGRENRHGSTPRAAPAPARRAAALRGEGRSAAREPPIWRRLEVRSDLTLDIVHRVLQAAFGWTDSHLWRFSLGGDPFSSSSQVFLCSWDVEEGEWDDEGGLPAAAIRLDEAVQVPGEILSYAYDYGDNWELTLRLENVLPAAAGMPSAVAVDGRRAAPPEDCGGRRTADELAEVLEDPSLFALDEITPPRPPPGSEVACELQSVVVVWCAG